MMNTLNAYLGSMSIATTNTEKMVNFYEVIFKTRMVPRRIGRYLLYTGQIGNIGITLTPNEVRGVRAEQSRYHLSFVVPNLEEYLQLAKQAGAVQTQDIDLDNDERYCEIVDPDGNPIELIELVTNYSQEPHAV